MFIKFSKTSLTTQPPPITAPQNHDLELAPLCSLCPPDHPPFASLPAVDVTTSGPSRDADFSMESTSPTQPFPAPLVPPDTNPIVISSSSHPMVTRSRAVIFKPRHIFDLTYLEHAPLLYAILL